MSVDLVIPFNTVLRELPYATQLNIEDEVNKKSSRATKDTTIVVLGVLAALGGVFVLLAAYQILPHGINAISAAGVWAQVGGYGMLGTGFLVSLIGYIRRGRVISLREGIRYEETRCYLRHLFSKSLKSDQIAAIRRQDSNPLAIDIYLPHNGLIRSFIGSSRKLADGLFSEWLERDAPQEIGQVRLLTLAELKECVQQQSQELQKIKCLVFEI